MWNVSILFISCRSTPTRFYVPINLSRALSLVEHESRLHTGLRLGYIYALSPSPPIWSRSVSSILTGIPLPAYSIHGTGKAPRPRAAASRTEAGAIHPDACQGQFLKHHCDTNLIFLSSRHRHRFTTNSSLFCWRIGAHWLEHQNKARASTGPDQARERGL